MKLQKIMFLLILGIFFTGLTLAQDAQKIENRVKRMKEALQLTDDQATKIQEIYMREEQQSVQDKQAKPVNKRTMMKRMRQQMMATDKEVEKLLTPEQLKKYDSYKKQRMNQLKSSVKGRKFKEE
jgi:protein CpxP